MRIHIKFGDTNHVVEISTDATLGDLREKVRDATRVLPPMQKLLGKPNLQTKPEDSLLSELGIRDGTKLMLIGNQVADVVEANRASAVEQQHESKQVQLRLRLPHHVWMLSPYASALADAYVDGRGAPLEGGGHLLSLLALDLILTRINRLGVASTAGSAQLLAAMGNEGAAQIRHPFLASFSDQHSVALQYVHRIVRRCYEFTAAATGAQEPGAIREVVDRCIRDIDSLSVGEWLLLPAGWVGQTSSNYCFLLLHRVTSEKYTVVVMNRGRDGQEYHPRWATAEKIRVSPILHLDGVHRERVVDHGFWLTLLSLWMRGNDPQDQSEFIRAEVFYDVLLPWLVEHGAHQENFETRGASEALFPWAADATATAAPYPKSVTQQGCSTICSASSAMKGAMTAACFLAGRLGEMTPAEVKQLKFALKYELFVRAAEDVHNYAKRFVVNESLSFPSRVKSVPGSLTQDGASNVVDQQRLCRAMSSLVAAGVKDTASGINLRDVLSAAGEQGVVLTQANHVLLSTDSLMNKMVFVYIGSLSVPECATFTALVADVVPCLARAVLRGAPPVEILFVSADQTRELYDQHAAMLPCSRAGFSPVALIQSLDCSKVPEMIAFGPDGALLHRDGVQALRADPEALLFPHGPWRAANPLSATDVRMLEVSSAQLAHHTNRRLSNGAITEDVGQQILRLVEAVKDVVDALPQDDIRDWTSTSATGRPNDAHKSHGSSDCIESQDPTSLDTLLTSTVLNSRDNGYPECSLLPTVSTARYCGNLFHTTPGTADDLTELTIPQSLRDLHRVLVHCKMIVSRLWARAGDSGTSSRVAVEMQLIEFISWAFMELIPVPGVGTGATVGADPLGSATRSVSADFYETDSFEWAQLSAEEDPQLETLAAIHYLLLSFGNAWQAVETPSRSADAERCLVSMEMLLVFDAVVRQVNGSRGGQQLALLLASDGGYYLSTTLGKRNLPFATVAASLELTRPRLLLVRACMLRYINHQHACFQHELYDLRMPDKLEIRRGSRTITFLRTFMDNLGYSIDDAGGQRGAQGSEMEKLMEWLCSDRTPLASKNPEFLLVRDVVLLAKFLGTMERREAQLLNRRKELDHFASWRICFEEDTPGRQMSAGWRTSPTSLQWECLMVRGRDLDVADITVHGFGRRELLYGEGLVLCSPIDVGRLLGIDRPTEDDVLHARQLPNLGGGTMNIEEVEVVLSCLTTPYLRIPLLLDFFSTQDRHTYLFLPPVQALLRAVLFEPADFVLPERLLQADPREVPMRLSAAQREEIERQHLHGDFHRHIDEDCLGTTYGLLLNELANAPSTVLQPVSRLVDSVKELGPSSVYSANASYVLFVVELVTGVLNFVRFSVEHRTSSEVSTMHHFHTELLQSLESVVLPLLTAWLEESVGNLDTPSQCVVYAYQSMVVRALWKGAVLNLGGTSSWGDASNLPTVARHITRLLRCSAFVRARHGFGMGMQRTQLAAQEGDNELSAEDKLLRFLQAHGLNTSRATPQLLEQGKQLMMSGGRRRAVFLQIIGQHTRDTVRLPNLFRSDPSSTTESKRLKLPPADLPELELFQVLHEDHRDIMSWMEGLSSEDLSTLLSSVVQTVLCDVDGSSPTSSGHLTSHGSSSGFAHFDATAEELWTREQPGCYASSSRSGLAFHLQSCELFWHHDELRPVPDSMSHFTDFENILGKDLLQCGLVSRHEHRHWVHIVGTPYDVVEWTSPPEATDQGVHHPIILSGDWPGEMARSAAFEGDIFDRPVEVMSPDPWPVRAERWAVELVKCVYAASYPHGVQFAPLAMALPEDTTGATETECDEMHFLYNDAPQYPKNPENATWKEIVAYRRPQPHFHVFNLVPHARKMYRSLVYSTNQRLCLHSLALMGRERRRDALQSTAFVAGELKRRISVDTTLEIHRHNATLGGRETYVPAALLQGLVPSALLEAFYIWQGDDDLLRGYHMPQQRNALSDAALSAPESEEHDHWFNYSVEIHLRGTGEAQSLSHCTVVRRNDRSYTPISQLGNSTEGVVGATSSMSEEAADPALIALLHRAMPHIPQAVCAAILERSKAMDIAGAIAWARSSDHQAEVEALVSDHRLPEGANHVAAAPGTRADDLILVNLLQWPHLAPLLAILTQLEDCSHVLVWARRCASLSLGDQLSKTVVTSDESGGEGNLYIDHIDLPRLRARFEVRRDGANSRLRMFLADQPGWRLAEADDAGAWSAPRLNVLRAPFQQCVVLVNSTHETTLLVPNHDFSPVEVREDPFCPLLLFDRSSFTWREAVPSPFYLYPVHPSHGFLQPPTLAASLYYAVMQCATQHYVGAIRTLEACYTDCPFSAEEAFMAALFERTMTDRFPDAHAVRLKLAHAVQYSTNTYEWPLVAELHGYLEKKRHVRADCRLSRSELVEVLKRCDKSSPLPKAQLELLAALIRAESAARRVDGDIPTSCTAIIGTPSLQRCGHPWEQLLVTRWEHISPQKLKRLTFRFDPSQLEDDALVSFIWGDKLLSDEENGGNRKLGFYFLYALHKQHVSLRLGEADVTSTLSQLWSRWFHLRHARWGREAAAGNGSSSEDSTVPPSWSATVLQLMELFPTAAWPAMAPPQEQFVLANGINLQASAMDRDGHPIQNLQFAQARRSTFPDLFEAIHHVARELHTISSFTEMRRVQIQASWRRIPTERDMAVHMYDHVRGRVLPQNSALTSVSLGKPRWATPLWASFWGSDQADWAKP